MKVFRCVFLSLSTFSWWEAERWGRLNTDASEGTRAIRDRMSLSISCVMKKDWEGLHGPTASEDRVIAMHRLLHFRLSKLRPAAREVRLQKRRVERKVKRLSSRSLSPKWHGSFVRAAHLQGHKQVFQTETQTCKKTISREITQIGNTNEKK